MKRPFEVLPLLLLGAVVDAAHILQHLDDTQIEEGAENEARYRRTALAHLYRSGAKLPSHLRDALRCTPMRRACVGRSLFLSLSTRALPCLASWLRAAASAPVRASPLLPCAHPPAQAVEQVAFADRILLNKCDLVDESQRAAITARLKASWPLVLCLASMPPSQPCLPWWPCLIHRRSTCPGNATASPPACLLSPSLRLPLCPKPMQAINASAEIIECKHAAVDLKKVVNIHAFSLDRVLAEEPDFLDVRLLCCVDRLHGGQDAQ